MSPAIQYRPEIDGLRAIAVLSVIIFHAFPSALPGGFTGVDIFFVISGYLITSILIKEKENHQFSVLGFYKRRVLRIIPALYFLLLAVIVSAAIFFQPEELQSLGKHLIAAAGFASNFLLWSEIGYFDTESHSKPLLHLWSLAIEEQFYLLIPVVYLFFKEQKTILYFLIAIFLLSFGYSIYATHYAQNAAFYSPASRFWELASGCILAFLMHNQIHLKYTSRAHNFIALIGFSLITLPFFVISPKSQFPGLLALPTILGTFLIIFSGTSDGTVRKLLASKPLIALGLISYPLYLWHWPIICLAHLIYGGQPSARILFAALGLSLLLACITYLFMEKPIRALKEKKSALALTLAAGLPIFMLMGYAMYHKPTLFSFYY